MVAREREQRVERAAGESYEPWECRAYGRSGPRGGIGLGGTGSTQALKRGVRGVLQAVGSTPKGSPNPKLY